MKNLRQRQCKNLSIEDIADIINSDVEVTVMLLEFLKKNGIVNTELHIYCDDCSAENVIACDGFYELPVLCHECGKQIDLSTAESEGIKRYTIDVKGLEEFVRHNYYDIYSKNIERKIIDFEPKVKKIESEIQNENKVDEDLNKLKAQVSDINSRYEKDVLDKNIREFVLWIILIIIISIILVVLLIDIFVLKDKKVFIYKIFMELIKGSILEKYESEILMALLGGAGAVIGAIYVFAIKRIKMHFNEIINNGGSITKDMS